MAVVGARRDPQGVGGRDTLRRIAKTLGVTGCVLGICRADIAYSAYS
jgi:hypothetical protein